MKTIFKRAIIITLTNAVFFFLLANVFAFMHAYRFTRFSNGNIEKSRKPENLGFAEKLVILFTGVNNPKPGNDIFPNNPYEVIKIQNPSGIKLDCWLSEVRDPAGIFILFHGYSASKSSLVNEAAAFNDLGYASLLADLSGHGDSEGMATSIGFHESEDVYAIFEHIKRNYAYKKIILYGVSMGATAILRAASNHGMEPFALVLECPFASLLSTVRHRFEIMELPQSPFSEMLVFWGGVQNNFNGFAHDSALYAKEIEAPVLLMFGAKDNRITMDEIGNVFADLRGFKRLTVFEEAGHEHYIEKYPDKWPKEIISFLNDVQR